ncbi:MAG: polysaccharide biosynthesis C-terminal domain-containing protein, partial [Rhodospirillales bacterium]|nr:polysaccharide biosynthesis C-terminal domain-containing protein [Rhodospirillales bacterium]
LNLGLNLLFMHPLKAVGPALATSLSSAFNAAWLFALLARRGHFHFDTLSRRRLPRILFSTMVMAAALWGAERLLPRRVTTIPEFLLLVLVGAVFYFGPGVLLRAFDLREFLGLLRRRRKPA